MYHLAEMFVLQDVTVIAVIVEVLTTRDVEIVIALIILEEDMVEGGRTRIYGGKHCNVGDGITKIMGSM